MILRWLWHGQVDMGSMKQELLLSGVQKEATKCTPQLGHWLSIVTACVVCKILTFEIFFFLKTIWECCCSKHQDSPACIKEKKKKNLSLELGQIMFRRLTHLQKNCMMVHFSFQYCWNITQNLFLGSFPLVHNSSYCCIWADAPARTVGWRDPGFIHTSFLKELWPNAVYVVSLFLHMILILGVNS